VVRAMVIMKCPRCGLINPEVAQRCDCGYDFIRRQGQAQPPTHFILTFLTLFLGTPFGIAALAFRSQARRRFIGGDFVGAQQSSRMATTMCFVGITLGTLCWTCIGYVGYLAR
jgi:hypothetical protein